MSAVLHAHPETGAALGVTGPAKNKSVLSEAGHRGQWWRFVLILVITAIVLVPIMVTVVLAFTPGPVQRTLAHAFAHPRLFNLTISSVPGPAVTRYLRGCRLREVHSAVPLGARHGLSIGVVIVGGNVCFGLTTDPATFPDAEGLADDISAALDELLEAAGA